MLTLPTIRSRMRQHEPGAIPNLTTARRAAVAVILRGIEGTAPEILFIKRAEHDGDP